MHRIFCCFVVGIYFVDHIQRVEVHESEEYYYDQNLISNDSKETARQIKVHVKPRSVEIDSKASEGFTFYNVGVLMASRLGSLEFTVIIYFLFLFAVLFL